MAQPGAESTPGARHMLGHPHQQLGEATWQRRSQGALYTLQSIQSETSVGNEPPLTGGSRALQSRAGRQGLSPQRLHDSHGEGKHRATDSCCREPECCRGHVRGCFCCQLAGPSLEQIQQNSPRSIPKELGSELGPTRAENPQELFAGSSLPSAQARFPLQTRQREESANHNIGKNVLPASWPALRSSCCSCCRFPEFHIATAGWEGKRGGR